MLNICISVYQLNVVGPFFVFQRKIYYLGRVIKIFLVRISAILEHELDS